MDTGKVVYKFPKNSEEEIRFSLRDYKERHYFDVRLWFLTTNGREYHPTRKGITLSVEHLDELRKGLERIGEAVSEMALQPASNSIK